MGKKWSIRSPDPHQIANLTAALNCHPVVAAVLINRGFETPDDAARFLRPSLASIRSPFLMKDMDRAVSRILRALRCREKVLIFGDYDVDGMTATALLLDFLTYLGMDVHYYIPDRLTEGYGLSPESVEQEAIARDVALIITVDCGITSHQAVRRASRVGIDVIITDHHEISFHLPEAFAIVDPKQPDCPSDLTSLAGVGVVFNLVLALRKALRDQGFWETLPEPNLKAACDLVALGTVADMVPILEENRVYVKTGLEVLAHGARPGVKALLDVCELTGSSLGGWDVAFKLAPRLNAAGRLRHASMGCELLTTSNNETAQTIAEALDRENKIRQTLERHILSDIVRRLEVDPHLLQSSLVLEQEGWHQGVIGIVASRLVNRYERPVVLIAVTDGRGKGSARSPEGFNLFEALKDSAQYLEKFGGHAAAAGLTLAVENIPAFRRHFEKLVSKKAAANDFMPRLHIDLEIAPAEIHPRLADELEGLAPFGTGHPEPLFMLSNIDVLSARLVGGSHMQMRLRPSGNIDFAPLQAIYFNMGPDKPLPQRLDRVACHIRWNRWKDHKTIQLVIRDFVAG
jgi:single-stranded-DNA-specific exonuclease